MNLNEKTGEISGIPTAAGTATLAVKAENSEGSDTRALSITVNNAVEQTPVRYLDADGKEPALHRIHGAGKRYYRGFFR